MFTIQPQPTVELTVELPIVPPRKVTTVEDREILAERARWSVSFSPSSPPEPRLRVFAADHDNVAYHEPTIPDWVPRPPEGWDAPARALYAQITEAVAS